MPDPPAHVQYLLSHLNLLYTSSYMESPDQTLQMHKLDWTFLFAYTTMAIPFLIALLILLRE